MTFLPPNCRSRNAAAEPVAPAPTTKTRCMVLRWLESCLAKKKRNCWFWLDTSDFYQVWLDTSGFYQVWLDTSGFEPGLGRHFWLYTMSKKICTILYNKGYNLTNLTLISLILLHRKKETRKKLEGSPASFFLDISIKAPLTNGVALQHIHN